MGPWKGRFVIVLVSRARARERNGISENPKFPAVSSIRKPLSKESGTFCRARARTRARFWQSRLSLTTPGPSRPKDMVSLDKMKHFPHLL